MTPQPSLDRVFAALADPTRRAILARLARGQATVSELVEPFALSQPAISKHLKVLEGAGLVARSREAQFRPVRLKAAPLAAAAKWLGGYERCWEDSLDQLEAYVGQLAREEELAMDATPKEPAADREVVVERRYRAPPRLLFLAWSRPEHVMKWFGPKGWPLTLCEMEFREGGRFRFAMTGPDGIQNTPFGGEYLEIVPDRRIVYDNGFELPDAGRMVVSVEFEPAADGGTRLTVRTVFDTVAMRDDYVGQGFRQGLGSGLDQLGEVADALASAEEARP